MNWDPTIALIVAAVGATALGLIYVFGQPRRPPQGKRSGEAAAGGRREPVLGEGDGDGENAELDIDAELERLDDVLQGKSRPAQNGNGGGGKGPPADFDKIVSLFVQAADGEMIRGSELVVAAEKAGLTFGAMNIFHRLVDGRPEQGPVFSVANMVKPGSFDMRALDTLQTPGLSFFMTLPGPLPGLDAWDTMLPAAQRMAELLDAQVLDDRRNTLGRQRIAHIRDELRAYDRKRESQPLGSGW
ncbi:cell division protein ZipA [Pseudomarimonas salicorniae]|uniref:Cell division protein ZipA n=1 Tax=Pseudomarimonas salicorniae TaxID=2933270 RepID=A0ABT0GLV8_9GAMM|nr:cell division protein ZipA [Lysobacter sp. CAU 1642]MCK7595214.1 cell division protein ZipA [Lysobacter sp. CAU 1642]